VALPLQTFDQFVANLVSAWAANVEAILGATPTLEPGDALFAEFQSIAIQLVFLQGLAQQATNVSRAQTSENQDLDSWMAQFDFARLSAVNAAGSATLSTSLPASQAFNIPAQTATTQGGIIQTVGGAIQYQLVPDTSQAAWSPTQNAYVFPQGATSINVTVQALVAGSNSNVLANQLTQIGSSIPGINFCTNPNPIQNGMNAETDQAFLNRFVVFINSLSLGVQAAIESAVLGTQQGLSAMIYPNLSTQNIFQPGFFTVVVNNGTGSVPQSVLTDVSQSIEGVRGLTINNGVIGPVTTDITVAVNVLSADSTQQEAVEGLVQAAIQSFIQNLPVNGNLQYLKLAQVVWNASPLITDVEDLLVNGAAADLTQVFAGIFVPTVTVGIVG
jgi:Baseplate J-like protein